MRSGRATRTAAVLMAGLVGAAVLAPGMAFAQGTESTCVLPETMTASGTCELPSSGGSGGVGGGAAGDGTDANQGSAIETTAPSTTTPPTGSTLPDPTDTGTGSADVTPTDPTSAGTAPVEVTVPGAGDADAARKQAAAAVPAVSPAQVTTSLQNLTGLDLTSGLPIADALKDLPTGNLDLGDVTIPGFPSSGSFSSPRDACLFLASKVTVDEGQAGAIGQQFASFCGALPGSFDPTTGYGSLPDLVTALDKLCHGLKNTHHHGYHHHAGYGRDDINCDEVSADEAQAIYEADRSDPNNLDGDDDGKACEWNPDDYETVTASYDGYPQGGVATGDSAPGLAPGTAAALAGLGVASLAGASRRRDEDADEVRA